MGRRTYYFVAPLIPPALSSTLLFSYSPLNDEKVFGPRLKGKEVRGLTPVPRAKFGC